jgi:hypothetical protein
VNLSGNERVIVTVPGRFSLLDAADNRLLLRQDLVRNGMAGVPPGESVERELSWWDASVPRDLSKDGSLLLFSEVRGGIAVNPAIFLRRLDGTPARTLGAGTPFTLAPDGRFVLAQVPGSVPRLELVPTGAGEAHSLVTEGIVRFENGWWFPDNKRILFLGAEPSQRPRLFVEELELTATKPRAVSPPGVGLPGEAQPLSPDGKLAFAFAPDGVFTLYPTDGGDPRPGPALLAGEWPLRFTADSQALYVARGSAASASVERVDLASGKRELWKTIAPGDLVGLKGRLRILPTADGTAYVYGYERDLSELFVVDGAL